jgi:transposase
VSQFQRRRFTREFKIAAVRMLESGHAVASVARKCEVDPGLLHRWRQEYRKNPVSAFPGMGRAVPVLGGEADLERMVGRLTMEVDFLKKLLQRFENGSQEANGVSSCTRRSKKK